jgi:hypothetical protein
MENLNLTVPTDVKALTKELVNFTGYTPTMKVRWAFELDFICKESIPNAVRNGELPFKVMWVATSGVMWAIYTGRLNPSVERHIVTLSPYNFVKMLAQVTVECETQNDVPRWLNAHYS